MERLTRRELGDRTGGVLCNPNKSDCNDSCMYATCKWNGKALEKLKQYEDLDEQGLLVKLPCKVGDTIYKIPSKANYGINIVNDHPENNRVYEQRVNKIEFYPSGYLLQTCEGLDCVIEQFFSKTWFLTESEAEQALMKARDKE